MSRTPAPAPAPTPAAARAAPTSAARAKPAARAVSTPTPKPVTRDRAATEERILDAVGRVLARDGFSALGVSAIAKQAGVDKVLIYRYFGGLPELLRAWGDSGRFWPSVADLLQREPDLPQRPIGERLTRFFDHFIDELRARPLTLAILAAEVHDRNELTAILETEREQWGEEAGRVLGGAEFAAVPHAQALTLLLVAGVQYLLLRARKIRVFGGIDLQTNEGWAQLKSALRATAQQLFPPPATPGPAPRASGSRSRGAAA